jgi:hypothetical protein
VELSLLSPIRLDGVVPSLNKSTGTTYFHCNNLIRGPMWQSGPSLNIVFLYHRRVRIFKEDALLNPNTCTAQRNAGPAGAVGTL